MEISFSLFMESFGQFLMLLSVDKTGDMYVYFQGEYVTISVSYS